MLRHQDLGIASKTDINDEIAKQNIQPDSYDHQGNFNWFFGFQNNDIREDSSILLKNPGSQLKHKSRVDSRKKRKFEFLANMGLLDDNEILSNKLINVYGKRLFDLIHDKSRAVEANKSMRKKVGLTLGLTHDTFSENKRIDMHLCWFMVQKIRAIQELDSLLNTSPADFKKNYEHIIARAKANVNALYQIIPSTASESYIQEIYNKEQLELGDLAERLGQLTEKLDAVKDNDQYHRNKILQSWQRKAFRHFNYDFKQNEGKIGLHGKVVANALENVSNSNSYNDAEYAIQEHIYTEWQHITKSQLWMVDEDNCGNVLSSKKYCHTSTQRKELLLGACIAEQLAQSSTPDTAFNCVDKIKENTLQKARDHYQDRKKEIA